VTEHNYSTQVISVLVYNHPGVMAKVAGLFTRRGFNVESITAGKAKYEDMLRLTIVVKADKKSLEQIQKQLFKIIDTVKVSVINPDLKVEREMALIKVRSQNGLKSELFQLVDVFRGRVVDASPSGFIIEITGPVSKIEAFINLLSINNVFEIARTGTVAINRWPVKNQTTQEGRI